MSGGCFVEYGFQVGVIVGMTIGGLAIMIGGAIALWNR